MRNFRREFAEGGGLSSYPHPWLMPEYWQFPTVSMDLGPITAIYRARFIRYLEQRGLIPVSDRKVWCFIGDGEYQKYAVAGDAYTREHFWGVDPRLARLVARLSDTDLRHLRLGGHDHEKVYAGVPRRSDTSRRPHGHPRAHHQGLRPRRR